MSSSVITRHFATITEGRWGARQVHYRRVGSGPLVILFHQSPLSSRDMLATMDKWKSHFTCIAPDSPGFGLSDPLGVKTASMNDFADAAIEFMNALGIKRAAVYGFHTGAMISGAIAAAYPKRIVCAVGNGYVMMSETEKKDIVRHYLPSFTPSWDGSHLTWLWARMREQTIFFPWYAKSLANRLYNNVPLPEALHTALLDFMRSGDHYRVGYRAAFLMKSNRALETMRVPMLVTAYVSDVLATHLPRIRKTSNRVTVQRGGSVEETHNLCRLYIAAHRPPKALRPRPPTERRGNLIQDYVYLKDGQLRLIKNTDGPGRPIVVLHDALGSIDAVKEITRGFIGLRPVIALELPGHGESDDLLKSSRSLIGDYSRIVHRALVSLKIGSVDIVGLGMGGLVGLELALRHRSLVKNIALVGAADLEGRIAKEFIEKGTPDIEPDWFGGYLLKAWHIARDHGLFWPWYTSQGSAALRQEPQIDPDRVQQRVLDLFRSNGGWQRACRAQFSFPWRKKLQYAIRNSASRVVLAASAVDPLQKSTWHVADAVPGALRLALPTSEHRWAAALVKMFE